LNQKGWAVPHWPLAHGGQPWSAVQRYIFMEELMLAAVPLPLQFNCFMVGPVIAAFGNEAQKARFLSRAANLDDWWCQGFSEPGAGSDLAGLKTKAVLENGEWVITGQKTWTTLAQHADWIFVLARTDATVKKQEGISFIETKPEVCWQLPMRRSYENLEYEDGKERLVVVISEYDRRGWGEGGHDFDWYCSGNTEAHNGANPVYIYAKDELVELIGQKGYDELVKICEERMALMKASPGNLSLMLHPADPK
jgi:hypothetical protein